MSCDLKTFNSFLCLFAILLFACSLCNADDDFDDYNKQKRAIGSSGLFPFPRVGRSDPSLFSFEYDSPYSFGPYENYDEMRRQDKRQGLVPFPRVGRSSSSDGFNQHFWVHEKRSLQGPSSAANPNAMWFGPRLGKRAPHGEQGDHHQF